MSDHYVRLTFGPLNEKQLGHLRDAERALARAGISFDTGTMLSADGDHRDWELDLSLRGPLKVAVHPAKDPVPAEADDGGPLPCPVCLMPMMMTPGDDDGAYCQHCGYDT